MVTEYRYRAVQRPATGGDWEVLTSKLFTSLPALIAFVDNFKTENRFFGWRREYGFQRQPYGDWETFGIEEVFDD